jgi:hypothetical protein
MSDTRHTIATYEAPGYNGDPINIDNMPEQGSRADDASLELYGLLQAFERWIDGEATMDRQSILDRSAGFIRAAGLEPGQLDLFPEDSWHERG